MHFPRAFPKKCQASGCWGHVGMWGGKSVPGSSKPLAEPGKHAGGGPAPLRPLPGLPSPLLCKPPPLSSKPVDSMAVGASTLFPVTWPSTLFWSLLSCAFRDLVLAEVTPSQLLLSCPFLEPLSLSSLRPRPSPITVSSHIRGHDSLSFSAALCLEKVRAHYTCTGFLSESINGGVWVPLVS